MTLLLWHALRTDLSSPAKLGSDVVLVAFGIGIIVGGVVLFRGPAEAGDLWRVCLWMVGGVVAVTVIVSSLVAHLEGLTIVREETLFFATATTSTGSSLGLLVGWYDLKSRHRARTITANEAQFRAVFEGTLDALVLADDSGEYVQVNQAAADLFGVPRTELVGKRISDFTGPDVDFEAAWADFRASDSQRGLFQIQRPDGETRTVEFVATRDVLPGRHLSALRDVTERERSQQRVAAQREQLSFLNRMLRHHVRNNLQVVVAHAERLNELDGDSAVAILDRIDAIEDFLEQVRRFTASLAHDQPLHMVALSAVISEAISDVTEAYPDAEIDVEIPETGVVADALLKDVFVNLISNAVQHSDSERQQVNVRGVVDDETTTITITDDGPGIDDERKEDIFEWIDSPAADVGFGLYLTRALVTRYGGRVWAGDATDLTGAAFSVQLHRDLHDAVSTEGAAAVHRL